MNRLNHKTPYTSLFIRALLVLLMLFTFAVSSSSVNASQNHDVHTAAMSQQDMQHEYMRECAAACGFVERNESRTLNINQRKKEKELDPEQESYPLNIRNYRYQAYKFRTVFIEQQNSSYLRFAQLRL